MKKLILYISIISLAVGTVNAQTVMTLEECRQQAISYNKELKKAGFQQEEALANQKAARTAYLPQVGAEASAFFLADVDDISIPGGFLPTAESAEAAQAGNFSGTSNVWSPGMSLEMGNVSALLGSVSIIQPIYAGGKIRNINSQADAAVDITVMLVNLKYAEVVELTDQAFWNVAMIDANIELAEKYIEMLSELEETMIDMYDVGLKPASEKLRVSVQKNEAELQLMKAKNGLKVSKMYLNQVLGLELDADVQIDYPKPLQAEMIDMQNGVSLAFENRNELKVISKQIEIAELEKRVEEADYLPEFGLSLGYQAVHLGNLTESVMLNPMIGAQLTIPIYQWGQAKHKRKAADFKKMQVETELDNTQDLVNLEVLRAKVEIEEAYEAIAIAQKNIGEAEESLEETKASFEVGLNTTTDLLNAQADWQNANSQLITAMAKFKTLTTKWERVTGTLAP
ncbi:TolC family protein [Flammeovirgaceae bacterium SG7u.111]|nr:TolC family protein [Flammeovirgaceae bacterium SG7u.132]WPO36090.1 TolC family protein [Flammeovirgaceae bacterium SG7u.111]